MTRRRRLRTLVAMVAAVAALTGLAACSDDGTSATSSGSTSSSDAAVTTPLPSCGHAATASPSASDEPPASSPPALAVHRIAHLDDGVTSIATRCDEQALYLTQQTGRVVRLDVSGSTASPMLVLDLTDLVTSGGEQGLLGIAFAPDGSQLYLAYTNKKADQELDRWKLTASGAVDEASRTPVLVIPDFAPNHNGGQLVFGPDGYLYWGMGDGGGAGDSTKHTGQDPTDLLGDILRLDVTHPAGGKQYAIPPDNPFADGKRGAPEVFAYGLRNPWKLSFDRANGDLWIADVGQNLWEEIDHVTAAKASGANFGWSAMEGTHPFNGGTNPAGAILPVHEYSHDTGACAVIGGYVYRGTAIAGLQGVYLYGDNCAGQIAGLRLGADGSAATVDIGLGVGGLSTFGEGVDGELYAASVDGTVVRITAA